MSAIYVKEQGAYIKKINKRIIIEKNKKTIADVPIDNITNMSIFGNVQITTQALQLLLAAGIDISFFSYSGKLIGQVAGDKSKNIFLRFEQYDIYNNIEQRLNYARTIVKNKIGNQIALIEKNNWENIDFNYKEVIKQMQALADSLPQKKTSNEIMGVEGNCSKLYFSCYGHMFKCACKFDGRNRRPPKDPINVILSLAYTFLTKEVAAALDSASFETYIGFLHGIRYGRKSMALDIVEEYRQPVVDRLVLYLFNKRIISEFDFKEIENQIRLTDDGFKKFCGEYEKWMKNPISANNHLSFREVIQSQTEDLKNSIRKHTDYKPYSWS